MIVSAGVALLYEDKILLVHPRGAKPDIMWGIPKGKQEKGESIAETAVRETEEEVGIRLSVDEIEHGGEVFYRPASGGEAYKKVVYFVKRLDDLAEIGLKTEQVPTNQIRQQENDMARFMTRAEAEERMFWKQKEILELLLK